MFITNNLTPLSAGISDGKLYLCRRGIWLSVEGAPRTLRPIGLDAPALARALDALDGAEARLEIGARAAVFRADELGLQYVVPFRAWNIALPRAVFEERESPIEFVHLLDKRMGLLVEVASKLLVVPDESSDVIGGYAALSACGGYLRADFGDARVIAAARQPEMVEIFEAISALQNKLRARFNKRNMN
jgi:hypothetical protein